MVQKDSVVIKTKNNRFVGIAGTTCVGKSAVAVQLAKKLNTFVISADSMQIYKGMDVGTAKVTAEEMQGVPHFMLDVVEPNQDFSAFQYAEQVKQLIYNATKPPILCGGTGFYFDSLLYPSEFSVVSEQRRKELKEILEQPDGISKMVAYLSEIDPKAVDVIDVNNPKRVLRAVEIAENGQSICDGLGKNRQPLFDAKIFVLQRSREDLYKQIDIRVDAMVQNGLIEEVKRLVDRYGICETTAFAAIGYKEILPYLQGQTTVEQAVDAIKLNTRHYAKRQISYFKRLPFARFVEVDGKTIEQVAEMIFAELTIESE